MAGKLVTVFIAFVLSASFVSAQNGYPRVLPGGPFDYPDMDIFSGYQYSRALDEESQVGSVPGVPGRDYPTYDVPPETSFRCPENIPGYYADPEARCQAFHICQEGNRVDSFLCTNGTLFNQQFLVCDWWYNVDCSLATEYYRVNEDIFQAMQEATQRLAAERARKLAGYNYDRPSQPFNLPNNNQFNTFGDSLEIGSLERKYIPSN